MGDEYRTVSERENVSPGYSYHVIENREEIAEAIRQLNMVGVAQIGLVTIHLMYKKAERQAQTRLALEERAHKGSRYLLQHLRTLVRRTDQVFLQRHTLDFVLLGANVQGARIVEERLWEALLWRLNNMDEQEMLRPFNITIGHSALPEPQTTPGALLSASRHVNQRFTESITRPSLRSVRQCVRRIEPVEQDVPEELPRLAKQLGVPYLSLLPRKVPPRLQQVVDAKLAHELHCYPIGRERNILTVAMRDPQDHQALERLRQATGLRIFPVLAHPEALENALKHLD